MQSKSVVLLALVAFLGCSGKEDGGVTSVPVEELDAGASDTAFVPGGPEVGSPDVTNLDDAGENPGDDAGSVDAGKDTGAPKVDTGPLTCLADLEAKGIPFKKTMARGVVDAVNVTGPINGVMFASGTATTPMGDPVACAFVQTLYRFAELAKSKGFVRIGTLGSYCYRCCCSWSTTNFCRGVSDPEPMCGSSGYSNHSFGRAVDIRYLYKADGTRYDINDTKHWVKWATTETCSKGLPAQTGISKELYQLACDAASAKIFGICLTPNYNDAHRNHLHCDIGEKGTPSSWVVRSLGPITGIDDAPESGEGCGDE